MTGLLRWPVPLPAPNGAWARSPRNPRVAHRPVRPAAPNFQQAWRLHNPARSTYCRQEHTGPAPSSGEPPPAGGRFAGRRRLLFPSHQRDRGRPVSPSSSTPTHPPPRCRVDLVPGACMMRVSEGRERACSGSRFPCPAVWYSAVLSVSTWPLVSRACLKRWLNLLCHIRVRCPGPM